MLRQGKRTWSKKTFFSVNSKRIHSSHHFFFLLTSRRANVGVFFTSRSSVSPPLSPPRSPLRRGHSPFTLLFIHCERVHLLNARPTLIRQFSNASHDAERAECRSWGAAPMPPPLRRQRYAVAAAASNAETEHTHRLAADTPALGVALVIYFAAVWILGVGGGASYQRVVHWEKKIGSEIR